MRRRCTGSRRSRGLDAKAFVDQIVEENWRPLPGRVDAEPDFFIRTTDEGHKRFVQEFIERIRDERRTSTRAPTAGLYCVGHETFISEDELVDGKCPDHGTVPEYIEEQNWFFRLSDFQQPLLDLYDERPDFVLPRFRYNEARSLIEAGLEDFSISRQGQPWGVPIPWDPEQVTWVWVDALDQLPERADVRASRRGPARRATGPRSATSSARTSCASTASSGRRCCSRPGTRVPKQLFVHGYLLLDNRKISKTLGNVIDPLDLIDVYGVDPVRFWAARAVSFGQDGNGLARLARTSATRRELGERPRQPPLADDGDAGPVPRRAHSRRPQPARAVRRSTRCATAVVERLDVLRHHGRARRRSGRSFGSLNKLRRPTRSRGSSRRTTRTRRELDRVLYTLADGLRAVAVALAPYLPETAPRILEALGQPDDLALGERRAREDRPGRRDRGRGAALPARSKRRPPLRDRHPRAPRRVRRPAGRARSPRARGGRADGSSPSARRSSAAAPRSSSPTRTTEVFAILGHPPARGVGADRRRSTRSRELLAHPRAVAVGETGLDFFRDYAPHDRQRALFGEHLELAAELGKPVVDPQPRRRRGGARGARVASTGPSCCTASRTRPRCRPRSNAGTTSRSPATSTYKNASELRVAAAQVPPDRILAETDARTSRREPLPRAAERARERRAHACEALARDARRGARPSSAAQIDANARRALRPAVSVAPKKELGQHFLVDENILGVIGRLAELDAGRRRARGRSRARRPHALPRRRTSRTSTRSSSTARSSRSSARRSPSARTSSSRFGDALRLDLATLDPPPTQARREPAVQRRDADRRREPRRPADASSTGR